MSNRIASAFTDWQERASEFKIGDGAFPKGESPDSLGTVVAVYPAIGMVDVQCVGGTMRYPAEELHLWRDGRIVPPKVEHDSVPGGEGQYPVSNGPGGASATKVALYWKQKDRQYHATRGECEAKSYGCPKCKEDTLRKAIYKRREGASERLWACPGCMFLIKDLDIHMHDGGD